MNKESTPTEASLLEHLFGLLCSRLRDLRLPIASSMICGLAAYLFCFTNKLEIMDDLTGMFGQGVTLTSGRWGLELTKWFTPSVSLPWLNGLLSLILITASVCMVITVFDIRSPLLRILLPAVMVTFPTQTCTFAYMFTSVQYALSLFLAVLALRILSSSTPSVSSASSASSSSLQGTVDSSPLATAFSQCLLSCALLVLSLSIYQAYIAVAASCLLTHVIYLILKNEKSEREIIHRGLTYVAVLLASLAIYYTVTLLVNSANSTGLNGYAERSLNGIPEILFGIRVAYTSFIGYFIKGYYDLVPTGASIAAHFAIIAAAVLAFVSSHTRMSHIRLALLTVCVILFPLSVNCVRVISSLFHNLMLYSFTSVYILAAVVTEVCTCPVPHLLPRHETLTCPEARVRLKTLTRPLMRDIVCLSMAVIAAINIYTANTVFLKMYLQLEQAESVFTSVLTSLRADPDFNGDSRVAFIGGNDDLYDFYMIDTDDLVGIREGIIGTYSQDDFIRYFLGAKVRVCGEDVTDDLASRPEVTDMPSYPYAGCIKVIDGIYVVKLG